MHHTTLNPPRQKRQRAPRMRQHHPQPPHRVKHPGQKHPRHRNGRLHREPQRQRQHVAVGAVAEDGRREPVVRVQEDGQRGGGQRAEDGEQGRVVESLVGGEPAGAEDDAAAVGEGGEVGDGGEDGGGWGEVERGVEEPRYLTGQVRVHHRKAYRATQISE
ncbi:hypothetical protein CHGG_05680 [Chaetomium globosum CBS 148.51]|uniref:Uncharacterized protein n=1 Tax=Chaetomium globosum (strain ATCC 6205 / CBS 148.51 / DSM 1962 / NBRC 6347 / NRRL 1970) TaxID=306901 RepID=Q2H6N5_CHAGB|nr:uncharacterized protein CHGG_05680 [Chaetomium globosum CBS 148.51]EAQ89061.1 hypothetical protein CHGG_05680 [Chaetomium globosum CBS 148.51]